MKKRVIAAMALLLFLNQSIPAFAAAPDSAPEADRAQAKQLLEELQEQIKDGGGDSRSLDGEAAARLEELLQDADVKEKAGELLQDADLKEKAGELLQDADLKEKLDGLLDQETKDELGELVGDTVKEQIVEPAGEALKAAALDVVRNFWADLKASVVGFFSGLFG